MVYLNQQRQAFKLKGAAMKVINHHKKTGRQAEGKRQTGFIDGPAGLGKQSVFVKQDFTPVDDRILDNKGRITISNDWRMTL